MIDFVIKHFVVKVFGNDELVLVFLLRCGGDPSFIRGDEQLMVFGLLVVVVVGVVAHWVLA